jgi:hypothetical protein
MCGVYGHWWVYGAPEKVPEGCLCECGRMVAHYEKCPTCGQERLIGIPLLQEEPTIETNEFNGIDGWGNPLIYWVG